MRGNGVVVDDVHVAHNGCQLIELCTPVAEGCKVVQIPLESHGNLLSFPLTDELVKTILKDMTQDKIHDIYPSKEVLWLTLDNAEQFYACAEHDSNARFLHLIEMGHLVEDSGDSDYEMIDSLEIFADSNDDSLVEVCDLSNDGVIVYPEPTIAIAS